MIFWERHILQIYLHLKKNNCTFVSQQNPHIYCWPISSYSPMSSLFGSDYVPVTQALSYSHLFSFSTIQGPHVGNRPSPNGTLPLGKIHHIEAQHHGWNNFKQKKPWKPFKILPHLKCSYNVEKICFYLLVPLQTILVVWLDNVGTSLSDLINYLMESSVLKTAYSFFGFGHSHKHTSKSVFVFNKV